MKKRRRWLPPALLKRARAAAYCDHGVTTWDRAHAAGLIPAGHHVGGGLFWSRAELAEWCRRGCPPRAEWEPVWRAILAARLAPPIRKR